MGRYGYGYGYDWKPYVSVAQRRRNAEKKLASLRKKGLDVQPVAIEGRKIATTFWGAAWCDHLESFSDYSNRLPRGRTYVRNGSVCHLGIAKGKIDARVSGSELYTVQIEIKELAAPKWLAIKQRSAGQIGSLLELLQGKLSDQVMRVVTDREEGLFPLPKEISFHCDCPDWAGMCKHIAAVMYGIGSRLDSRPELLFTLRGVNHEELIAIDAESALSAATTSGKSKQLASTDLSDVFGIDLDSGEETNASPDTPANTRRKRTAKKKSAAPTKKVAQKRSAKRKQTLRKKASRVTEDAATRKTVKKKKR
jgi:uncharacterized Zn finger protein